MKLSNYLDTEKLQRYIEEGWVMRQRHPFLPLSLYVYTRETVFKDKWDDITTKTRCLIVDDNTGDIVARPFEKFHNFNTTFAPETWYENLPKEQPEITEKLDGSLGVLYTYEGKDYVASKGSFVSEHAEWATYWYNKFIGINKPKWPENHTVVFEMINQDIQHHIVHYNDADDNQLIVTGIINNETGEELDYDEMAKLCDLNRLSVVTRYVTMTLDEAVKMEASNLEGFVASWPRPGQPPLKIKIKLAEFLRKQKVINHTNPKDILDILEKDYANDTDSIPALVENTTDFFKEWVYYWEVKLNNEYTSIMQKCVDIYNAAVLQPENKTRKDYALFFTKPENKRYSAILFAMLDKDVDNMVSGIWKLCSQLTKGQSSMKKIEEDE